MFRRLGGIINIEICKAKHFRLQNIYDIKIKIKKNKKVVYKLEINS